MPIFSHTVTGYLFALLATVVWSGNFVVARRPRWSALSG